MPNAQEIPEHRADALFALPVIPRRAALLGELPGWAGDLVERRVEVVAPADAEVVVADGDHVSQALAAGRGAVVVDGPRGVAASLRAAGLSTTRLLPIPVTGSPVVYADLAERRAARFGIERVIVHPERWRTLRNRAAALLIVAGLPLPVERLVTLGVRRSGRPAFITAAHALGVDPASEWSMLVSKGSVVRRNAFFLIPPGRSEPEHVLKFSRVPEMRVAFDREQRGFELAAAAGISVQRHATTSIGRFVVDDFHASVETAALGTKLATLLRRPGSRSDKLAVLDRIARWLIEVARETAVPPAALGEAREHYARDVAPFWAAEGAPPDLVDRLPPVPGAFQHNDMAEENLIVDGGDFRALDWEWANPHGLPLGDLVYFGVHVLRIVDGALSEDPVERDGHFAALLAGEAPSSPVMFGWLRDAARELQLPPASLGPLVTLSWLERGRLSRLERWRAEEVSGAPVGLPFAERAAKLWLEHPALGPRWDAVQA
ncbi:MAG: hypothetical protein ABR583_09810 [Gaiellaceae bacterium]